MLEGPGVLSGDMSTGTVTAALHDGLLQLLLHAARLRWSGASVRGSPGLRTWLRSSAAREEHAISLVDTMVHDSRGSCWL